MIFDSLAAGSWQTDRQPDIERSHLISETYEDISNGKTANSSMSTARGGTSYRPWRADAPPDFNAMGQCPPLSYGVTVYSAAEIR